jgi:hypothetical protein
MAIISFKKIDGKRKFPPYNRKRIIFKLSNLRSKQHNENADSYAIWFYDFCSPKDVLHRVYHYKLLKY